MEINQLKNEIKEYLDKADIRFLKLIHGMVSVDRDRIYPDLEERISSAEDDVVKGNVLSANEFHSEYEQWKKQKKSTMK